METWLKGKVPQPVTVKGLRDGHRMYSVLHPSVRPVFYLLNIRHRSQPKQGPVDGANNVERDGNG